MRANIVSPSKRKAGISKIVYAVVVIAAVATAAVAIFLLSSAPPESHGTNISCTDQPGSSAVQISILGGASNSANGPGYSPDMITVFIGRNNTVTWISNDSAHHTITTSSAPTDASFNSGDKGNGAAYTCTFSIAGTYQYHCVYHSWMTGTIVVKSAS